MPNHAGTWERADPRRIDPLCRMQSQLRRQGSRWLGDGLAGPIRAPASTEIAKAATTIIITIIIATSNGSSAARATPRRHRAVKLAASAGRALLLPRNRGMSGCQDSEAAECDAQDGQSGEQFLRHGILHC